MTIMRRRWGKEPLASSSSGPITRPVLLLTAAFHTVGTTFGTASLQPRPGGQQNKNKQKNTNKNKWRTKGAILTIYIYRVLALNYWFFSTVERTGYLKVCVSRVILSSAIRITRNRRHWLRSAWRVGLK